MDKVMELSNILEHIKHQHYLSIHLKDLQFPLDGSDWARLVSMRLHTHERLKESICNAGNGFWLKIHSDNSPLFHERKEFQRAMNHWFYFGDQDYAQPLRYSSESSSDDPVWQHLLNRIAGYVDGFQSENNLDAITAKWVSEGNSFWVTPDREGVEGGQSGKRIRAICKQKQTGNIER